MNEVHARNFLNNVLKLNIEIKCLRLSIHVVRILKFILNKLEIVSNTNHYECDEKFYWKQAKKIH